MPPIKVAEPRTGARFRLGRDYLWIYPLAALFVLTAVLWGTAVLSGLLQYGRPARAGWSTVGSALPFLIHDPLHPADAWPEGTGIGGPIIFWAAFAALSAAATYGTVMALQAWTRRAREGADGLATSRQIETALGEAQAKARIPSLRPALADQDRGTVDINEVAVSVGIAVPHEIPLWATIEESCLLVAPPREGKTQQIILPGILSFPGTVLATSSKTDVLYATADARERYGKVAVLDPTGLSGWPEQLRWPLTWGCENYQVARRRAETLSAATKTEEGTKGGGYFVLNAKMLLTCWLHAAALGRRPAMELLRWSSDPENREAVYILSEHGRAALAGALAGQHDHDPEERATTWSTAAASLVALYDEAAAAIFAPEGGEVFDIRRWLTDGGTLFLLGEDEEGSALAPINAAFSKAVFDTAKRIAARSPNGRLPRPFGGFLDELANVCPLPEIPSLMSVSGSQNMFICAVLQSYAQAEERWGQLGVRKLYASSTVKLFLGGISDPDELKNYSQLTGNFDEDTTSVSDDGNSLSVSTSVRRREVLEPADIRMIPERGGLLIHRRTPAIRVRFTRAYEGPHAELIRQSTARSRERIQPDLMAEDPDLMAVEAGVDDE
ncbi:type IV secretory system conjugative DNA transfer family protein [Streptomyces mirabilis]|uniref:type IV secretory system conjugative DNA transfer family protein n=1 Tax=Streptomyces mirabilis TaxID=68239 RepID=UPI0033D11380